MRIEVLLYVCRPCLKALGWERLPETLRTDAAYCDVCQKEGWAETLHLTRVETEVTANGTKIHPMLLISVSAMLSRGKALREPWGELALDPDVFAPRRLREKE